MPIRIDLHDNSSEVKVRPRGKDQVNVESGCEIDKKRFEALLDEEIKNRILSDKELSDRIDDLEGHYVKYLDIDELEDGKINISLINDKGEVVDTKTITLTEKIIKSAELDEESKKLIYTCNDDSVIELDISSIVDNVEELISKVAALEADVAIIKTDIGTINSELSILDTRVSNAELSITGLDTRLTTAEGAIAAAVTELSILDEKKVDKYLSNAGYTRVVPKELTPDQIKELLIYVDNNGIPSYAKLSELGYARIRDIEDIDKVDVGDLLIDME